MDHRVLAPPPLFQGIERFRDGNSDHTPFTIIPEGHLRTAAVLDYEQPTDADGNSIYEVVVLVADGEEGAGNEADTGHFFSKT